MMTVTQPTTGIPHPPRTPSSYRGTVVYLFAFDVAYEMGRLPLGQLLGQPVAEFSLDATHRNPRHLMFHRPQMVRLPPLERIGPMGPVRVERSVKLLPVGAVSISIRIPFEVEHLEQLVVFHDLQFSNGSLHSEVKALAEELRLELSRVHPRMVPSLAEEEAYTVFCLDGPFTDADGTLIRCEDWLEHHRRRVACLLTQETGLDRLSRQETEESTIRYLSYYQSDLVVVDWDAALVIDEPRNFDETLYVMELANLQLAELEAYDRILDTALERAYRDLSGRGGRPKSEVLQELREIRIDLARFDDELSNITKFFGDWHLARVYENLSARFHLADWHRTLDEKLRTLNDLYQLLSHDQNNRWMLILETTIVLLFVLDLALLVLGLQK